ncbi:hypothetical protein Tco_0611733 [Tanacetum coccineum]
MSSIGELTFFLGLQVQQKEDGIFISQDKYVAEILGRKYDCHSLEAEQGTSGNIIYDPNPMGNHLMSQVLRELVQIVVPAATTASSLEAEQDSGSGPECQVTILGVQKLKFDLRLHLNKSYDPPLSRVNTLGSGEDNLKLKELIEFCTKLFVRALDV